MDDDLAYFLDLRLRLRGRPEARAIVDRCLALIARAQTASPRDLERIAQEVEALRADLIARFGRKAPISLH